MNIVIASIITSDRINLAYILMNSVRKNKMSDTVVYYNLFIEFDEEHDWNFYVGYFSSLQSENFTVIVHNTDEFRSRINPPEQSYIYYARCLLPTIYGKLDRVLYLDVDTVFVRPGLEDLWSIDLDGYYVGAGIDVTFNCCPPMCNEEFENTGTSKYFNSGVLLMNIPKIRGDGMDKELARWLLEWDRDTLKPILWDQSLMNYLFRGHAKILDFKYNNTVLAADQNNVRGYDRYLRNNYCTYSRGLDSLKDAVIVHFPGDNKPYMDSFKPASDYPYRREAVDLWNDIIKRYGE